MKRSSGNARGMYVLACFPDCTEFYRGPHQGDSSFIVGRGLPEHERLFRRKELREASDYAKQTKLQVEAVPNTALCSAAVAQLWGEL